MLQVGYLVGQLFQVSRLGFSRSERNTSGIFASAGMRTGWSSSSTLQWMLQLPCMTWLCLPRLGFPLYSLSNCVLCILYAGGGWDQESLASPLSKLHFCMARTAQKYNLKLNWYHPWHTLYKPDHYVLRVGDKSRIEENWKTAVPLVTVATLRLLELGALVWRVVT